MTQPHHRWLEENAASIARDYARLHALASTASGVQRSGHGGESTWIRLLQAWLPDGYGVGARKYIVPERAGSPDPGETDIVVYRPSYPVAKRAEEEVMAAGVAAAFSVKLTLTAAGLAEAAEQARVLAAGVKDREGTPEKEMLSLYPYGVLAHSHDWTKPKSTPFRNVAANVDLLDSLTAHPRELIDLVCVADLAAWERLYFVFWQSIHVDARPNGQGLPFTATSRRWAETALIGSDPNTRPAPVAVFIGNLYRALARTDSALAQQAEGFQRTDEGTGAGVRRQWALDDIFSAPVITAHTWDISSQPHQAPVVL